MRRSPATGVRALLGATLALLAIVAGSAAPAAASPRVHSSTVADTGTPITAAATTGPRTLHIDVPQAPGSAQTISLDADLYLPATTTPSPAVLLAHGFGGSKKSVRSDAERLRGEGFVVLAYSARGFGASGGRISLDSLNYEVADASRLVDFLGTRPEVQKREGNPVVGVYGASYGGALALMLGATDPRVDAVVASITWNDLAQALVPQSAPVVGGVIQPGVFKQAWATQLFSAAAAPRFGACGRFTPEFCALYTKLVGGESLDAADRALLAASSPSSVLAGMTAPTLLLQGRQDTLFGFDQADANARELTAAGATVKVSWFSGGHDGGLIAGTDDAVDSWLSAHLSPAGTKGTPTPAAGDATSFDFTVPSSARGFGETRVATAYPGLESATGQRLSLDGRRGLVVNPPGALPATISSLPGTGALDSVIGGLGGGLLAGASQPAQQARFSSAPIGTAFILAGAPTVTVTASLPRSRRSPQQTPGAAATEVVLFAQLRVESGDNDLAVGGGVQPIRVSLPADGSVVQIPVTLPATTWRFERGDVVSVSLRTTDAGYLGSPTAATFVVDADGTLSLPTVASADPTATAGAPSRVALIGIPVVLLVALALALLTMAADRRRRRLSTVDEVGADDGVVAGGVATIPLVPSATAPPLIIRGLTKNYRNGLRAVDDLTFTVQRGQVLGLLGPNGAGKTTALRMVTGLLRPDAGEIEIFGEKVTPGARVLTRVGCFIEGPGFLPHLSGRRNLRLFWAASGRPLSEARLVEALEIADLGAAVDRKVAGYSQGMRQRLAIAQAMLGMPELLILDEPTNGLDPPQIFALRGVLRRYAETGRTVIVSSHLLGEVEQTCSDVVVMARGRLLAAGTVAEVAGETSELTIEVTDVAASVRAVSRLEGAAARELTPDSVRVLPGGNRPESVVAAIAADGIGIRSVSRGRHLEETFLAMVGSEGVNE